MKTPRNTEMLKDYNLHIDGFQAISSIKLQFSDAPDDTEQTIYANTRHEAVVKVVVSFIPDTIILSETDMQKCTYICDYDDTSGGTGLSGTSCSWQLKSTGYDDSIDSVGKKPRQHRAPATQVSSMTAYVVSRSADTRSCAIAAGICINGITYTTRSTGENHFNQFLKINLKQPPRYTKDDVKLVREDTANFAVTNIYGEVQTADQDNWYLEFTDSVTITKWWDSVNEKGLGSPCSLFGYHFERVGHDGASIIRNLFQVTQCNIETANTTIYFQSDHTGFIAYTNEFTVGSLNKDNRPTVVRMSMPSFTLPDSPGYNWNQHPYFTVYDQFGNSVKVTLYQDDEDNLVKIEAVNDEPV